MESALKQAIVTRGQTKAALTRCKSFLDTCNRSSSTTEIQKRLEKVTPLFEKFDTLQCYIESEVQGTPLTEEHANAREIFENTYFEVVTLAEDLIQQARSQSAPTQSVPGITSQFLTPASSMSNTEQRVKLPTIELPIFDGSYSNWVKFRDTFESLIHHNASLSNIEKFHYLNSSLKGNAARTIQALGISEINYTLAWNSLKDRYEDLKTLKHHHVRSIYEVPPLSRESLPGLRNLIDNTNNNLLALRALGEPTEYWDTLIIYLLTSKLDANTQREWERRMSNIQGNVSLRDMLGFLENHCKYLERYAIDRATPNRSALSTETRVNKFRTVTTHVANSRVSCSLCKGDHLLHSCSSFLRLTPIERRGKCQELQVCFICLNIGHRSVDCSRGMCKKCSRKHNTLLHIDYLSNGPSSVRTNPATSGNQISNVNSHDSLTVQTIISHIEDKITILATAIIHIKDHRGIKQECRVLLDSGSQSHFISERLVNKLGLPRERINIRVSGISRLARNIEHQTHTNIISRFNGFNRSISCLVLPIITENIPNRPIESSLIPIPTNFMLADPQFNIPREVDMIIGGDLFWELLCVGRQSLGPKHPSIQKTQLGWIIVGTLELSSSIAETRTICNLVTNEQLHDQLAKFWEIEHDITEPLERSHYCEEQFNSTVTRDTNGRYIVGIPFNDKLKDLGDSMHQAERRFRNLERRLQLQPQIREEYIKFMSDYESLGHMTEITDKQELNKQGYYPPHHAVFKSSIMTTKLRVVFDGSAKTSSGISLNDAQHTGLVVQDDLLSILLRFCKHRYIISADIEKMYRQIRVRLEDRKFQRILWHRDKNMAVKVYELNTVTYGT
ncbi:hypothetical protein ANTPLA_LOCUS8887 [Anthophora plagiata]